MFTIAKEDLNKIFIDVALDKKLSGDDTTNLKFGLFLGFTYESNTGYYTHAPLTNAFVKENPEFKEIIEESVMYLKRNTILNNICKKYKITAYSVISDIMNGNIHNILIDYNDVYTIIKGSKLLNNHNIGFNPPNVFDPTNFAISSINCNISFNKERDFSINTDDILKYQLEIDGNEIDYDLLKTIIESKLSMIPYNGKFYFINNTTKDLEDLKELWENIMNKPQVNFIRALYNELYGYTNIKFNKVDEDDEIHNNKNMNDFIEFIKENLKYNSKKVNFNKLEKQFSFKLEEFQKESIQYMHDLKRNNIGCILADEMGLGKTLQVLSLLSITNNKEKSLIIVPASLLENWSEELDSKFPNLEYLILNNNFSKNNIETNLDLEILIDSNDTDIIIVSYEYLDRHLDTLMIHWNNIIIDEGQRIKNSYTNKFKNICKLESDFRLAMTGTPFENSRYDIWSIMTFVNPGLLGTKKEFTKKFLNSKSKFDLDMLKSFIEPFMIRRQITNVYKDFPKKETIKVYVKPNTYQSEFYKDYIQNNIIPNLTDSDLSNSTKIISHITNLKLICNNPDYLHDVTKRSIEKVYDVSHSAKFEALEKLGIEIKSRNECVLIFTQYTSFIPTIRKVLSETFGNNGYVYYGDMSRSERKLARQLFLNSKEPTFMVISLKTAGYGLNLIKATNVIHFDRWWNKAVEDQATARCYRIGQKKDIKEYFIVTEGTIESRVIDKIISEKEEMMNKLFDVDYNSGDTLNSYINNSTKTHKFTKDQFIELLKLKE